MYHLLLSTGVGANLSTWKISPWCMSRALVLLLAKLWYVALSRDMFWDPEVQQLTPHFSKFAASLADGKHQKTLWFCNYTPRKPCISIQRVHNTQTEHKGHLCPHDGGMWTSCKKRGPTVLPTPDPMWYQHWCVSQHVTFHSLLTLFWPFFFFFFLF